MRNPVFQFTIDSYTGELLCHFSSERARRPITSLPPSGSVHCRIDRLSLAPGSYRINTTVSDTEGIQDQLTAIASLDVAWGDYFQLGRSYHLRQNTCVMESDWLFSDEPATA